MELGVNLELLIFKFSGFIFKIHLYLCIHSANVYLIYHTLGSVFKKKKTIGFLCELSFFLFASKHLVF